MRVAPFASPPRVTTAKPMMWNMGRNASTRSPLSKGAWGPTWQMLATSVRCVSSTPFDRPVVPDEYGSAHRSSRPRTAVARGPSYCESSAKGETARPSFGATGASPNRKSSRTHSDFLAAAATASSSAGAVTTAVARESRNWCASSSTVEAGLAPVTAPPARMMPRAAMGQSTELGATIATIPPRRRPRAASAPATFPVAAPSSA